MIAPIIRGPFWEKNSLHLANHGVCSLSHVLKLDPFSYNKKLWLESVPNIKTCEGLQTPWFASGIQRFFPLSAVP
jgi:hypothetical protein